MATTSTAPRPARGDNRSSFLRLPAEVRMLVYSHLFSTDIEALVPDIGEDNPPRPAPEPNPATLASGRLAPLLVCRLVHREAHRIAWNSTAFLIHARGDGQVDPASWREAFAQRLALVAQPVRDAVRSITLVEEAYSRLLVRPAKWVDSDLQLVRRFGLLGVEHITLGPTDKILDNMLESVVFCSLAFPRVKRIFMVYKYNWNWGGIKVPLREVEVYLNRALQRELYSADCFLCGLREDMTKVDTVGSGYEFHHFRPMSSESTSACVGVSHLVPDSIDSPDGHTSSEGTVRCIEVRYGTAAMLRDYVKKPPSCNKSVQYHESNIILSHQSLWGSPDPYTDAMFGLS